jgi:hypothetical protein
LRQIEPFGEAQAQHDALAQARFRIEPLGLDDEGTDLGQRRLVGGLRRGHVAARVGVVAIAQARALVGEGADRGTAQPEVVEASPVAEVVLRLVAGEGVVRNLIVAEAERA